MTDPNRDELVKLKPCPFCGGEAEFERVGTTRVSNIVRCTFCGASLESGETFNHGSHWNTRAAEALSATTGGEDLREAVTIALKPFFSGADKAYGEHKDAAVAAIAAMERVRRLAPTGWRLVPVEPTPKMLAAWYQYKNGFHFSNDPPPEDTSDYGAYRAMLAAAPASPQAGEG